MNTVVLLWSFAWMFYHRWHGQAKVHSILFLLFGNQMRNKLFCNSRHIQIYLQNVITRTYWDCTPTSRASYPTITRRFGQINIISWGRSYFWSKVIFNRLTTIFDTSKPLKRWNILVWLFFFFVKFCINFKFLTKLNYFFH